MRRRTVLLACLGVSGCLGTSGGRDSPVEPEADPMTYLPADGDGWTRTTAFEITGATGVGAERGVEGQYDHDAEVGEFAVEILRWSSAGDATDLGQRVYDSGWQVFVTRGEFSFAAAGPSRDRCRELLARSSALSEGYLDDNAVY